METITVPLAIIAIIREIKHAYPSVNGLMTLVVAALLGGAAGYFHIQGTADIVTGIMLGIAASGTVHVARSAAVGQRADE